MGCRERLGAVSGDMLFVATVRRRKVHAYVERRWCYRTSIRIAGDFSVGSVYSQLGRTIGQLIHLVVVGRQEFEAPLDSDKHVEMIPVGDRTLGVGWLAAGEYVLFHHLLVIYATKAVLVTEDVRWKAVALERNAEKGWERHVRYRAGNECFSKAQRNL